MRRRSHIRENPQLLLVAETMTIEGKPVRGPGDCVSPKSEAPYTGLPLRETPQNITCCEMRLPLFNQRAKAVLRRYKAANSAWRCGLGYC